MLGGSGVVLTSCADCGEEMTLRVTEGALASVAGVAHFAVPARSWWDNIGSTCATMLAFRSEVHVDRWCTARRVAPRSDSSRAWQLGQVWYADKLSPDWRRATPVETETAFASIGLSGVFWRLT